MNMQSPLGPVKYDAHLEVTSRTYTGKPSVLMPPTPRVFHFLRFLTTSPQRASTDSGLEDSGFIDEAIAREHGQVK